MINKRQYNQYKVFSSQNENIIYIFDNFKEEVVYDFHIESLGTAYLIKTNKVWVYHIWEYLINKYPAKVLYVYSK